MDATQGLIDAVSAAGQIGVCAFSQDEKEIAHCESPEYDDSAWKRVMGKSFPIFGIDTAGGAVKNREDEYEICDWSMADGTAALRKTIEYPNEVEGISTVGSKIFVTMTMLAPIAAYLDGKLLAEYRYWGDSRQCELVLSERHEKNKKYLFVLKTPHTEGDAHLGVYINCAVLERKLLELTTAMEQLKFSDKLAALYGAEAEEAMRQIDEMLDAEAVEKRDWEKIDGQIKEIDKLLVQTDRYAKEFQVHMIAHAHIDMNWLWDYKDTVDICVRDFRTLCDILDEYPDMRFSQSQTSVYDIVQKNDPETFERVLKHIENGKWEVTAATWTENDVNMPSGEGMAHNLFTAGQYVRNVLHTKPSQVCWMPDTFGHPASLPNILAKAGVKYYYHFRNQPGHGLSWFEGTDGSRVLDYAFGPYNNLLRPANVMPGVYCLFDKYGLKQSMFVYGVGDHGGGPSRADIEVKYFMDQKHGLPRFTFSRVVDFFAAVTAETCDFPVVDHEMNTLFEGCYTLRSKIKKYIRKGESQLGDAESVESYRRLAGERTGNTDKLLEAWRDYGFIGFHDIICGCNISAAQEHQDKLGEAIQKRAGEIKDEMFNGKACNDKITVYNQLANRRTDIVCTDAPEGMPREGWLTDEAGNKTSYQIEKGMLYFVAHDMPAMQTAVYTVVQDKSGCGSGVTVTNTGEIMFGGIYRMESKRYLLEISRHTGTIIRLYDKKEQKDVLECMAPYNEAPTSFAAHKSSNLLRMTYEQPQIMSAWMLGNEYETHNLIDRPEIRVAAQGNVFARVEITHKYNQSEFKQSVTLYQELDRIDFSVDIDWHEFGNYKIGTPTVKVGMTSDICSTEFVYETPFGNVTRKRHNSEFPGNRYVAIKEDGRSMALFNDCKFGFMTQGSTIFMTLVRGSYSPAARPDEGTVSANYAVMPYYGILDEAQLERDSVSFNQPLIAKFEEARLKTEAGICCENQNVVITCVKPEFDGEGLVVRLLEYAGEDTRATLCVPAQVKTAALCGIDEKPYAGLEVRDGKICLDLRAREVKSVRLGL